MIWFIYFTQKKTSTFVPAMKLPKFSSTKGKQRLTYPTFLMAFGKSKKSNKPSKKSVLRTTIWKKNKTFLPLKTFSTFPLPKKALDKPKHSLENLKGPLKNQQQKQAKHRRKSSC